ncbi:hypothetical protein AMS68_005687 [Peltaster fructicola]|uniref:Karyogamy protein n=1 Tax=Peltaster fructicola TaxID=286661 RepID=A0A6H0Y0J5_9PEZI|nr:hypothetical protein AMS68_005687 [Peltaster fructicola]
MTSPTAVSSGSDGDFHSIAGDGKPVEPQHQDDGKLEDVLPPPEHPLKSMQAPFEESILESNIDSDRPPSRANAELRRQRLLDAARFDDAWTSRWKQRQDAQYHPLVKLMAQITFGMHLLQQNQAKNDSEVVKILQNHVDEVDNFLERTAEDFDLAIRDIDERIRFLQLPMQHVKVFNIMLDDKQFRTQLLDGNDKIERIIDRTARAMNAALLDVQKGRQATRELSKYLNRVQYTWPSDKPDLDAIYGAMRGNEEGWKKCYKELQTKGNHLGNKLIELGTIIGEMSKMAATASRRVGPQGRPSSSGGSSIASSTILRSRFNPDVRASTHIVSSARDKPLPQAPDVDAGADRIDSSKPRPVSFHQRFEAPRAVPSPVRAAADTNERPKTSNGIPGRLAPSNSIRVAGPLSPLASHPPENPRPRSAGVDRANGTVKGKTTRDSTRSISLPALVDTKTNSHTRAASAVAPSPRNRDSFISQSRDALSGSSFARRWSIRKKYPGPTPEDYATSSTRERDSVKITATTLKSPSQPRLGTVTEDAEKTPAKSRAAATPKADTPMEKMAGFPAPPPEPEPKSQTENMLRGNARQSMMSNITTGASTAGAPSIRSSIKRRTLSIKRIFSRNS